MKWLRFLRKKEAGKLDEEDNEPKSEFKKKFPNLSKQLSSKNLFTFVGSKLASIQTKKLLKNPLTVISATLLGVLIGVYAEEIAILLGPLGKMYLYFLQMSVIPIIISSIVSNIGRLANSVLIKDFLYRGIIIFFIACFFSSFLGVFGGLMFKPGSDLSTENQEILNSVIQSSDEEIDLELNLLTPNIAETEEKSVLDFLSEIIPSNVFESLTSGRALELVFFFIILGIGLGMIRKEKGSQMIIEISTAFFLTFQKIINWALYLLPFGLVCLVSNQIALTGTSIINPLVKYIAIFYVMGIAIVIINQLIIAIRSKEGLVKSFRETIEPNLLAFTTRSSFACIPSCVQSLADKLSFERITTNLFIPLGITLGRYGNIFYFSLTTIFIAQIYNIDLSFNEIIITIIGSIMAGLATAGSTGIATLAALSIITLPLGIPLEAILIVLIALDVVIDPMRTLLIVNTNLMSGAIISKKFTESRGKNILLDV